MKNLILASYQYLNKDQGNMTVIVRNGHFKSIIVPQTLDSQTQKKNKIKKTNKKMMKQMIVFYFTARVLRGTTRRAVNLHCKILNLLRTPWSSYQVKRLSKGIKFILTPKGNVSVIKKDIKNFTRNTSLRKIFADLNDSIENSQG